MMDLHNHTNWSDGDNSIKEIVINAIENDIRVLGISDHFLTDKCNSLKKENVNNYIENIKMFKDEYLGKIKIYAAVEVEIKTFINENNSTFIDILNKLDYVLLEYLDYVPSDFKLESLDEILKMIKCKKGLAHTDILKLALRFSERGGIDYIFEFMNRNRLFWEINVGNGYKFFDLIINSKNKKAIKILFNKLKQYSIKLSIGSDTHNINCYPLGNLKRGNNLIINSKVNI